MITVLVVDDHELVRTGICRMLEDHADVEVIDSRIGRRSNCYRSPTTSASRTAGCQHARHRWCRNNPSFITDGSRDESHCCKRPRRRALPIFIIKAGAKGYITKGAPIAEMVRAINKVMQGGKYFSADIAEQLASSYLSDTQQSPFDSLSEREMQVAMMVVNCISAQEIADKLL